MEANKEVVEKHIVNWNRMHENAPEWMRAFSVGELMRRYAYAVRSPSHLPPLSASVCMCYSLCYCVSISLFLSTTSRVLFRGSIRNRRPFSPQSHHSGRITLSLSLSLCTYVLFSLLR